MIRRLVDHSTTMLLVMVCIFLFGAQAWFTLPRESSPDVTIPVVLVTTVYQGVAPEDIEGLVTVPLERELAGLKGVKKMSSTSAEGASVVSVEFEPDVVIEDALQRVRDRVSRARSDLPEDVDEPSIREIAFSDIPILLVNLAGPVDEEALKKLGEDLQDDVSRVSGVLDAELRGGLTRQVRVQVDPVRLAHYGLALHDVTGAIGDENVNIPGGDVTVGDGTFLVRTPGEFTDPRQVEDVAIKRIGDRPVFVRDVARVVWGYEDRETYARMDGATSVSLSVSKRPGTNIIEVAEAVKAVVAEHAETWPEGVRYEVLADQSENIGDMVTELQNNIITALLLVVGVMLVFMGMRPSLFVAVAIPLSMLLGFMVLQALGFTLNMVVLFSLILALGMLVDNAIVIVENIYRHLEMGKTPRDAAIDGTNEVGMAVVASTATTIAAFLPLAFWTGIMGQFMGYLPKTLIIVLTSSLLVALGFLPVLTARLLKQKDRGTALVVDDEDEDVDVSGPMAWYKAVLEFSIRWRYLSAGLGVLSLLGTFAVYGALNHGTEFFPDTEPNRATIGVRLPDGADLESTDRVVRRIETVLAAEENVLTFVAETGVSGSGNPLAGSQASANEARISVDFLPDANAVDPGDKVRVEDTNVTIDRLRTALAELPGAEVTIEKETMGPPVGKAIAVEVSGDDYHEVGAYAQRLKRQLEGIPGVTDLSDDYRVGRPELRLRIDRGAAKRVGVSSALVGNTVRTAVAGAKASALRDGEDEYDIMVELAPEERSDLQKVLALRLPGREDTSPETFPVPLSSVATYELAGGTGAIQHVDQDLVITIEGDVLEGYNENAVRGEIAALLASAGTPEGIALRMAGSNQEQEEAVSFLLKAFAIAVALILLVLVTQFDSLAMPLIILATVVLSLIGVLWGLILTGTPFGIIMTGIGVISLAGVVVNNAIVLLDYVGQLRERGRDVHDALIIAGLTRFRPVMLTAVTTVLGLVPMAIGLSIDFSRLRVAMGGASADWWGPMAIAVIFGLAFATVLTLVMVPTLYGIYDDLVRLWARVTGREAKQAVATAAKVALAAALVWPASARAITLEDAFAAAEESNLDLALVREQTIQAETQRGQAWSTLAPKLTTAAGRTFNQFAIEFDPAAGVPTEFQELMGESEPVVIQPKAAWSWNTTISQPLFSATALPLLRGAYKLSEAARLDEQSSRQQIRAGVARVYYGLHTARVAVELADQALSTAEHQLELAMRQVAAGIAPDRAVLQARLAVSRAEREAASAQEQLTVAEEAFHKATGLPRDVAIELPPPPEVPDDLDDALEQALSARPDLEAAARRAEVAELEHRVTWLGWAPRLDGRFTTIFNEAQAFTDRNLFWVASVDLDWVVWDGGARLAQARRTASQQRAAELVAQQQARNVEEEVRTAWDRLNRAERAFAAVEREVELSDENVRLAERAFEAGTGTWLEVEEAELGLRSAELALVSERMNRDLAAVDLRVAMGVW